MKTRGPHPHKALTATAVRALKKPGKYADGNGLYLIVDVSGSKRWELRTVVQRRRRDIGLGGLTLVSLAEAREEAACMRKTARKGGDPLVERRKASAQIPTFKEAAILVHEEHSATWKNKKHAAQWIKTLKEYTFPLFGDRSVDLVDTPDVLNALSKIWLTKPETARRVRQRIGTVLDWAKAAGHRTGDNPINGIVKGLPNQPKKQKHHAALPYSEVNSFIRKLGKADANESTRLAFEFLILTATRTSEVILAKWSEIEAEKETWTIPSERMKAGRKFRVPLSQRCIEILAQAKELSYGGPYIFPGRSEKKPLSTMVFLMMIRRMGKEITAHGFRSSFRDWAAELTNFSREVCEMALAHTVSDKVEAAYLRGDLFDKRRQLMDTWAAFVGSDTSAKILTLRA
ncbi:MAG: integrase arm-type DNA-binding domain-containing protein [Proteobacteria bacterium]|nr:integrase arm-type DNA-binding domain-containing protein [Pseudomonadota bacterium]